MKFEGYVVQIMLTQKLIPGPVFVEQVLKPE